jgi:hypothetical protein
VAALAVQRATAHRQATWPRQRDSENRAAAEGVPGRRSAVSGTSRTARQDTEMFRLVSRRARVTPPRAACHLRPGPMRPAVRTGQISTLPGPWDTPTPPGRVLGCQPQDQAPQLRWIDGRPGGRWGWVQWRLSSSRCQRRSVSGVTSRGRRRCVGSSRANADRTARSAQEGRGRAICRRRS